MFEPKYLRFLEKMYLGDVRKIDKFLGQIQTYVCKKGLKILKKIQLYRVILIKICQTNKTRALHV
jgi:hypothetical protein